MANGGFRRKSRRGRNALAGGLQGAGSVLSAMALLGDKDDEQVIEGEAVQDLGPVEPPRKQGDQPLGGDMDALREIARKLGLI